MDALLAKKDKNRVVESTEAIDIERINQRLNMLDQRLDNIDSMVTAVAERVMTRPLTINITCPNCGKNIEIALIGNEKPTG